MVMQLNQPATAAQAQPQYVITDADRKRQKRIHEALRAYRGELDKPLQQMPGQPDDNVLSNRCQSIVDRGVDFLFGKELEISAGVDSPEEAQGLLDVTWGRKEARIPLLQKLAMNGALSGEAFLRIVPGRNGSYRLVVVDPSTVFVKTSPQDCETVLLYCIEYSTHEQVGGRPTECFYREEITRNDPSSDDNPYGYEDVEADGIDSDVTWTIQHWTRVGDRGTWQASGEPILWPWPFPPLFSCQNLPWPCDFWGLPDITPDLIAVNAALNLVQSNINRVHKLYGQPIIYATGAGETVIDVKPGRIISLPTDASKITAVPISADIANALRFASDLRSDIDEQSSVPAVATGRIADLPKGTLAAVAIELMFMPLLLKTDKKRCLYGELIIDVCKALLVLAGIGGDIDITLGWQKPIPSDDLQSLQAAVLKQQLGISNTTIQRELGYSPEEQAALNATAVEEDLSEPASTAPTIQPTQPESPFIGRGSS